MGLVGNSAANAAPMRPKTSNAANAKRIIFLLSIIISSFPVVDFFTMSAPLLTAYRIAQ
jgi:hypothetical protein